MNETTREFSRPARVELADHAAEHFVLGGQMLLDLHGLVQHSQPRLVTSAVGSKLSTWPAAMNRWARRAGAARQSVPVPAGAVSSSALVARAGWIGHARPGRLGCAGRRCVPAGVLKSRPRAVPKSRHSIELGCYRLADTGWSVRQGGPCLIRSRARSVAGAVRRWSLPPGAGVAAARCARVFAGLPGQRWLGWGG